MFCILLSLSTLQSGHQYENNEYNGGFSNTVTAFLLTMSVALHIREIRVEITSYLKELAKRCVIDELTNL